MRMRASNCFSAWIQGGANMIGKQLSVRPCPWRTWRRPRAHNGSTTWCYGHPPGCRVVARLNTAGLSPPTATSTPSGLSMPSSLPGRSLGCTLLCMCRVARWNWQLYVCRLIQRKTTLSELRSSGVVLLSWILSINCWLCWQRFEFNGFVVAFLPTSSFLR